MSTPDAPETIPPEPRRAGRLGWRRVIFAGLLGMTGAFGIVHVIGGTMSALIAGSAGAAGAGGYALYKYPHVRRHFWGPWSGKREGKGRKGFSEAWQKNWRKGFKSPGNPLRNIRSPFRRSGPGARGAGHRTARGRNALRSLVPGRRHGAGGLNRRARAGSGSRSRHSGAGTGRRAGIFRRSGRGHGASRRPSAGSGRFRRVPGVSGWFRRHPATGGSRSRASRPGRTRRRTPLHPFGGRRTTTRPGRSRPASFRHPFGGRRTAAPAGRSRPRSARHPFGGRRTVPRTPGRARRAARGIWRGFGRLRRPATRRAVARRMTRVAPWNWFRRSVPTPSGPGRIRRGWHRVFGTPGQRQQRRRAARSRRANARNRRRRSRGTYGRRFRWYAPWRGRLQLRHRIGNRIGNWRARRLRHRGLLPVTGRTPLRLRLRHALSRRTWAGRWSRMRNRLSLSRWRRNRRMPRALLGGRHRAGRASAGLQRFWRTPLGRRITRRDRRRRQQWAARQNRGRPTPVPDTSARPVTPAAAGGNGHRPAGNTTGGSTVDTAAMADQIREMGGHEFADPQDVHDTLAGMHELMAAMQDTMNGWGLSLAETGVHPRYPETVHEVAGQMAGLADQLEEVLSGGVMRGPGG